MVELLCPPRPWSSLLKNPITWIRTRWSALSRPGRELATAGGVLVFGFVCLPLLIWIAGQALLGPYARGGIFRFIGDFFVALAQGNPLFWIIALGPLVFLALARLLWFGIRRRPRLSQAVGPE